MNGTIGEACSMYREPSAFVISVCMCVLSVERRCQVSPEASVCVCCGDGEASTVPARRGGSRVRVRLEVRRCGGHGGGAVGV